MVTLNSVSWAPSLSPPQCQSCLVRHLVLGSLILGVSPRNSPIELFCYVVSLDFRN